MVRLERLAVGVGERHGELLRGIGVVVSDGLAGESKAAARGVKISTLEQRAESGEQGDEPVQPEETLGGSMFSCRGLIPDEGLEGCGSCGVGNLAVTDFLNR